MPVYRYVAKAGVLKSRDGRPDLQPSAPPPPPPVSPLVAGLQGSIHVAGGATGNFKDIQSAIQALDSARPNKKIQWRRGYAPSLPSNWNSVSDFTASGAPHVHGSFKASIGTQAQADAFVAGRDDATMQSLARSIPPAQRITFWHEPEGVTDMPGSTPLARAQNFKKCFQHAYDVMKPLLDPTVQMGYIFTGSPFYLRNVNRPNIAVWCGADSDFCGLDSYNSNGLPSRKQQSVADSFGDCIDWLQANKPGRDIIITEWGSTYTSNLTPSYDRATWLKQSWAWFQSIPEITAAYYWSDGKYMMERKIDSQSGADLGPDPSTLAAYGETV